MNRVFCYHCNKLVELEHKVGFREECPYCKADLHICFNCRFYDESTYNECKESSAERVRDKERNNYCEYFDPLCKKGEHSGLSEREAKLEAAEALFKKE